MTKITSLRNKKCWTRDIGCFSKQILNNAQIYLNESLLERCQAQFTHTAHSSRSLISVIDVECFDQIVQHSCLKSSNQTAASYIAAWTAIITFFTLSVSLQSILPNGTVITKNCGAGHVTALYESRWCHGYCEIFLILGNATDVAFFVSCTSTIVWRTFCNKTLYLVCITHSESEGVQVNCKRINNIRYADDIVLLASSEVGLQVPWILFNLQVKSLVLNWLLTGQESRWCQSSHQMKQLL